MEAVVTQIRGLFAQFPISYETACEGAVEGGLLRTYYKLWVSVYSLSLRRSRCTYLGSLAYLVEGRFMLLEHG